MNKKTKHSLSGFTLVELIVVVAIFGLILAAALAILNPVLNVYKSSYHLSESSAIVDNVSMYIEDNIRYANRLHIYDKAKISDPDKEEEFLGKKVGEFKKYYCFDKSLRVSQINPDEKIYVMKISNPELKNLDADVIGTSDSALVDPTKSLLAVDDVLDSGKISLWVYDAYDTLENKPEMKKEWAVNREFYRDYTFTSSLNTDVNQYNTNTATTFALDINIFHNDKKYGKITSVTNTKLNNSVAFTLSNVSNSRGAIEEQVMIYVDKNDHDKGLKELNDKQFRYMFKNKYDDPADLLVNPSNQYLVSGNDIYLFYTKCPDLQSLFS